MNRKILISVAFIFVALSLANCQHEPAVQPVAEADKTIPSYHVPREKALAELNSFLADVDANNTTRGGKIRQIKDVTPILGDKFQNATRVSEDEAAAAIDTLLYLVNFEDEEGYAVLSAVDFLAPIIAVTDQGSADSSFIAYPMEDVLLLELDDYCVDYDEDEIQEELDDLESTITFPTDSLTIGLNSDEHEITRTNIETNAANHALRFVKRMVSDYCDYKMIDHQHTDGDWGNNGGSGSNENGGSSGTNEWVVLDQVIPMLTTKWDQVHPFNVFCPTKNNSTEADLHGRAPVGCVAVALGQLIAYNQYPYRIGMLDVSWPIIFADTIDYSHVAEYLYALGGRLFLRMDYGKFHSSSNVYRAVKTLEALGYSNVSKVAGYNETVIISYLKTDRPFFIRAVSPKSESFTNKRTAHAWIIDGFIQRQRNDHIEVMMHCNMGLGGECNGYYASGMFETTSVMDKNGNHIGENSERFNFCKNYKSLRYDKPITFIP